MSLRCAIAAIGLGVVPLVASGARPEVRAGVPRGWRAFIAAFDAYAAGDSVVGGSVVVLRHGGVLARHAYGLGDRERGLPPDPHSVYHWASITKTLTAIAILQLRDRGRLSLDDPITHYIPELRQVHDTFGSIDDVTLRMLLSHSAGFQNPTWPYGRGRSWEPFEPVRWEQLVAMMPYQELEFAPGSRFGYSNPAFIYLARVIEALTGDPWAIYVQKNIWTPLGMTSSFVGVSPYHLAKARAASYTVHLDYDGVLRRSTLAEMWRPVVPLAPGGGSDEAFGLSFYLYRLGATTVVGHTGEQSGFRSFFFLDPGSTTAVIGVLNTTNEASPESSARGWDALIRQAVAMVAP